MYTREPSGGSVSSLTSVSFLVALSPSRRRVKCVLRPFMRFMKPDTAEKFLQSHYRKLHPTLTFTSYGFLLL